MKKLLIFSMLFTLAYAFTSTPAQAQLIRTVAPVKDTCVNTDTTIISLTPTSNDVVSFFVKANKVSGTVAGKIYYQTSLDGTNWFTQDSTTLSNIAYNLGRYSPTILVWAQYRAQVTTSGTCKINGIRGYNLRRATK